MNDAHGGHRIASGGQGDRTRAAGRGARRATGEVSPSQAIAGWICALAVIGGTIIAIGGPSGAAAGADASPGVSGPADAAGPGAALYLNSCASCHGQQGEGTPVGPSLVGVGAASVDFYVRTGRMPLGAPGQQPVRQKPIFSDEEIAALVDHVAAFGDGPPIPVVRGGGDVARGYKLYTANCAACHAATGAGNAVGGGFAAVGLGNATDVEIGEAVTIGPGVMPPFEFVADDREALIAYIRFLRSAPAPGGAPIGGTGPVAEGFVAVVIGLTGLVLIARFAGSGRSEEDEDPEAEAGARAAGAATESPGPSANETQP